MVVISINKSGLSILETLKTFAEVDADASLADIAILMGQPKQTVHRALATLVASGLLEQDEASRRYRLGTELLTLTSTLLLNLDVRQIARDRLKQLSRDTAETVTLAVRSGNEIVFVDRFDGSRSVRVYCEIGRRLPLHVGAAAKAILAASDDSSAEDYLLWLHKHGAAADKLLKSIRQQRAETQLRGYSFSDQDVDKGVYAVGASILDHTGRPAAGFAVATLEQRLPEARIEELGIQVRRAADDISKRMGYRLAATSVSMDRSPAQ